MQKEELKTSDRPPFGIGCIPTEINRTISEINLPHDVTWLRSRNQTGQQNVIFTLQSGSCLHRHYHQHIHDDFHGKP